MVDSKLWWLNVDFDRKVQIFRGKYSLLCMQVDICG